MRRPSRWNLIQPAALLAAMLGAGAMVGFAAPARADADIAEFCDEAFQQSAASKRAVDGMINALNEAVDRVEGSAAADRDATIQRAQLGVHGLRAAAAQQLQRSADTIEREEPTGLSEDWQELADDLIAGQRGLADTILYQEYNALKPAVDSLNEKSDSFFTQCDATTPGFIHASPGN